MSEAQIVLCAFDKEKLLTASLLATDPGGGGGHYKIVERLVVSTALATHHHREGLMGLDETKWLLSIYVGGNNPFSHSMFYCNIMLFANYLMFYFNTIHHWSCLNVAPAVKISTIRQASTSCLIKPDKFPRIWVLTNFLTQARLQIQFTVQKPLVLEQDALQFVWALSDHVGVCLSFRESGWMCGWVVQSVLKDETKNRSWPQKCAIFLNERKGELSFGRKWWRRN